MGLGSACSWRVPACAAGPASVLNLGALGSHGCLSDHGQDQQLHQYLHERFHAGHCTAGLHLAMVHLTSLSAGA